MCVPLQNHRSPLWILMKEIMHVNSENLSLTMCHPRLEIRYLDLDIDIPSRAFESKINRTASHLPPESGLVLYVTNKERNIDTSQFQYGGDTPMLHR